MLMARLLGPEPFGLIGMVTVILNFIEIFKDLGLSAATIQKENITQNQVSNLFWVNILVATIISVALLVSSPVFAWFYNEPRLYNIVISLSFTFILSGLAVQHLALLKRRMEFGKVAVIEIASMTCGLAAGIISTYYNSGYWALVIWKIVQTLTATFCTLILCTWRPSLPHREKGTRTMLSFGGNIAGFNLANYASRNLDNILIGKFWGAQQLGLYATAYKLLLLPIQQINAPISSVALPALSKLQNEPEQFSRYYFKSIAILTFVSMPIVGFTASSIDLIIRITLGNEWLEAVPIFQLLLPAAYIGTFNVAAGWVFVCLGKVKEQMKLGILSSGLTAILFAISVHWGATAVAAVYGLSRPLFMFVTLAYAYQGTNLSLQTLFKSIQGSFLASLLTAAIVFISREIILSDLNDFSLLILSAIFYALLYFLLWMLFPKGRKFVFSIAKNIMQSA